MRKMIRIMLITTLLPKKLAEGEDKIWYDTLALFTYGSFVDYKGRVTSLCSALCSALSPSL